MKYLFHRKTHQIAERGGVEAEQPHLILVEAGEAGAKHHLKSNATNLAVK